MIHGASAIRSALAFNSCQITYRRGADSMTLRAGEGKSNWQQEDMHGALITYETFDFIVEASDLASLGKPQVGDLIEVTRGTDLYVYSVRGVNGEAPWRIVDRDGVFIRIHTDLADVQ